MQRYKHYYIKLHLLFWSPDVIWNSVCVRHENKYGKNQVTFPKVQCQKNCYWAFTETANGLFWGQKTSRLEIRMVLQKSDSLSLFFFFCKGIQKWVHQYFCKFKPQTNPSDPPTKLPIWLIWQYHFHFHKIHEVSDYMRLPRTRGPGACCGTHKSPRDFHSEGRRD